MYVTGPYFFPRGCHLQTRVELGLWSPYVPHRFHHSNHEMWAGFLKSPQSPWLSRSGGMLFLIVHGQRLVSWSIPFHKGFRSRPQSLRCDVTVPFFCFPQFECLSMGHSSDDFGDPTNCCFTFWIPGYFSVSSTPIYILAHSPDKVNRYLCPRL